MKFNTKKIQERLGAMNEEIEDIRSRYQAEAQEIIKEVTDQFFEAVPEIKSIHWTQYTPYFNDGEECTFSRHDMYYSVNRSTSDNEDDDEHFYDDDYEEGDQFSSDTIDSIDISVDHINRALKTGDSAGMKAYPYSYYCCDSNYVAGQGYVNTFNPEKARAYLDVLESRRQVVLREAEEFPNRDAAVEAFKELATLMNSISDETYQEIFGDHVKVVISRDGIETDEYDHD